MMYLPYFDQDLESKKKGLGTWRMSAADLFPGGCKRLRNTKINVLEALKYIYRLGISFIWAQGYIKRH